MAARCLAPFRGNCSRTLGAYIGRALFGTCLRDAVIGERPARSPGELFAHCSEAFMRDVCAAEDSGPFGEGVRTPFGAWLETERVSTQRLEERLRRALIGRAAAQCLHFVWRICSRAQRARRDRRNARMLSGEPARALLGDCLQKRRRRR